MELKAYQEKVLQDIDQYLSAVDQTQSLSDGWNRYWEKQGITVGAGGMPTYQDALPSVPEVTVKVPTGGGKTFIACAALKTIFSHLPKEHLSGLSRPIQSSRRRNARSWKAVIRIMNASCKIFTGASRCIKKRSS